jgi:hypothetical protein
MQCLRTTHPRHRISRLDSDECRRVGAGRELVLKIGSLCLGTVPLSAAHKGTVPNAVPMHRTDALNLLEALAT